jgi:hypothetical protein
VHVLCSANVLNNVMIRVVCATSMFLPVCVDLAVVHRLCILLLLMLYLTVLVVSLLIQSTLGRLMCACVHAAAAIVMYSSSKSNHTLCLLQCTLLYSNRSAAAAMPTKCGAAAYRQAKLSHYAKRQHTSTILIVFVLMSRTC